MSSIDTVVVEIPAPIEIVVEPPSPAPVVEVYTSVGVAGPRGLPGRDGEDGEDGEDGQPGQDGADGGIALTQVYYRHIQAVPSDTWVIQHGLDFHPNVTVVDSAGTRIMGDEDHSVPGQVTVRFIPAFGGQAFCS